MRKNRSGIRTDVEANETQTHQIQSESRQAEFCGFDINKMGKTEPTKDHNFVLFFFIETAEGSHDQLTAVTVTKLMFHFQEEKKP